MTAHDFYTVVVGEVGFSRDCFLYGLAWWEVRSIIRGYNRRNREMWGATRWQTYNLMTAQVGSDELKKHGIHKPTDLIQMPWEKVSTPISDKEKEELLEDIRRQNEVNP